MVPKRSQDQGGSKGSARQTGTEETAGCTALVLAGLFLVIMICFWAEAAFGQGAATLIGCIEMLTLAFAVVLAWEVFLKLAKLAKEWLGPECLSRHKTYRTWVRRLRRCRRIRRRQRQSVPVSPASARGERSEA